MDEVARFFGDSIPISSLQQQSSSYVVAPKLTLVKHKAHSEEVISKNGIQKTLHTIVKNSPYHLQIGSGPAKVDFTKIAFEAFLLYDCDGLKEVDFVKVKPMEFKSAPAENGHLLDVELRIKVLTSQHEDMLFRVRLQGYNPMTREEILGMTYLTPSIKVISKPEQLKKKQVAAQPSKKRSLTDMLVETVSRIERKQEEQQKLIERMMQQHSEATGMEKKQKVDEVPMWDTLAELIPSEKVPEKSGAVPDFEQAFANLVKAYSSMQAEEKPETIRRVIRASSTRDTERMFELLDLFWTEGLQTEPSFANKRPARERLPSSVGKESDGCGCYECPHQQELARIDEFYKEFLSSGISMPGY